jgi:hypothetical protein
MMEKRMASDPNPVWEEPPSPADYILLHLEGEISNWATMALLEGLS